MGQEMREIETVSTLDGSREPSLLYLPDREGPVPLLVGLHTWSADRFNQAGPMLPFCRERGWALLLPEFRGPNLTSNPRAAQACASRLARRDILDAVDLVRGEAAIDPGAIFLLGGSGGGHMALMMAAEAPGRWRAVSSWVPITDLAAWHAQNPRYAPHVEACCGGPPGAGEAADREYRERSPLFRAKEMAAANLAVHHGRFDRSVPYGHTTALIGELERLGAERFYFEVFDGGHEIRYDAAFRWFERQLSSGAGAGLSG
jgi:dipeptidyl aminopeptidase/acylaminoacyl peptidase